MAKEVKRKDVFNVLVRPIITEKSGLLNQYNQYVFEVTPRANKILVAQAIVSRYGVKPSKVNIVSMRGHAVRYGRNMGKTKGYRKAILSLPEGKSINLTEGVK